MTQISTLVLEVVSNPRLVFFTKGVILIQLIQSCRELNSRSSSFLQKIINVLPVYFCKVLAACKPMWTMCLSKIRLVKKKISVNSFYCRLYLAFASLVAQLVNKKIKKNAGDPGLIPGSGGSPGEVVGYPLQYSWTSLVAQMVKNPFTMWETSVRSLGWEDSPQGGHGNPLQYSCLENPHGQRSLVDYSPRSHRVRYDSATKHSTAHI